MEKTKPIILEGHNHCQEEKKDDVGIDLISNIDPHEDEISKTGQKRMDLELDVGGNNDDVLVDKNKDSDRITNIYSKSTCHDGEKDEINPTITMVEKLTTSRENNAFDCEGSDYGIKSPSNALDGTSSNSSSKNNKNDVIMKNHRQQNEHDKKKRHRPRLLKWFQAYIRDLFDVDSTQVALVPPMRTAIILMIEWAVFGIGNKRSTAFQLGALYVGFTDPNVSLGHRLHYMGLTEVIILLFGAVVPSLVWDIKWLDFVSGIIISYLAGLSPLMNSNALSQAMKLGTALFAINGAVNRNTNGYGGFGVSILWTFYGSTASLLAALIPEFIGNREAIRTDLYKVWHGFGRNLQRWGSKWTTRTHFEKTPKPAVTVAVTRTQSIITDDTTEDLVAKKWLLSLADDVDSLRTLCFCLSSGYDQAKQYSISSGQPNGTSHLDKAIQDLLISLGKLCCHISNCIQFPWISRYILGSKNRMNHGLDDVKTHASNVKTLYSPKRRSRWLSSLVDMIIEQSETTVQKVSDTSTWPRYSSVSSIPKRLRSAFPSKLKLSEIDERPIIYGYAIRFAFAFSVASIPELLLPGTSAHWFPMTVALIMGPTESTTLSKVGHRMLGTLIGIVLGTALSPLFKYPGILILLLGLDTYAACLYFKANYSLFTMFITSWVFTTTVGVGAELGVTIAYRCGWTFSAGFLVLFVTYIFPPSNPLDVTGQLIELCTALKSYAECVSMRHDLSNSEASGDSVSSQDNSSDIISLTNTTRQAVIKARVNALNAIHDSAIVLTPKNEMNIDPHLLAPAIVSDLIDGIAILQFASIVHKDSIGELLDDLDDSTFTEIDRLIHRLEYISLESAGKRKDILKPRRVSIAIRANVERLQERNSNRGPFSSAIGRAHWRLDESGVPSDAVVQEEEDV